MEETIRHASAHAKLCRNVSKKILLFSILTLLVSTLSLDSIKASSDCTFLSSSEIELNNVSGPSNAINTSSAIVACNNLTEHASTDVPKTIISDNQVTITSTLTISESGTIEDINIKNLVIQHSYVSDLILTLTSPSNTSVVIMSQPCGSEDNISIVFDDEASSATFPCPPNDGMTYQPDNALSAFDGESMTGTWTLTVQDLYTQDGGSLDSWTLEITKVCGQVEICDNGVDDDGDGSIDNNDPNCFSCTDGVLVNPGFENGLTSWDNYGNTSAIVDVDGNQYAHISGGEGGFGQVLSITPGTEVMLTFKAKKLGIVSFNAGISFSDASLNLIGFEHTVAVNTDVYQEYSVTFTAPENAAYVKAFAYKDDVTGSGSLDGFCLTVTEGCDPGQLTVERWLNISGGLVSDLISNANYPDSPDEIGNINSFQGPNGYADNYGTRVRGYIVPTESGNYTFNVTGDDNTILYLSSDESEANKAQIASVLDWSGVTDHTKHAEQTSSVIALTAGSSYYVELLHKEGTGGDHFQVYWQTPSSATWTIIPGINLMPFGCDEICDNNIDDDGDGLIDEYDPDCGVLCTNDCNTPYNFDWRDGAGDGAIWDITNGETSLTRVYEITGELGTYNVSVTLDNSDGQNIDFSNCGTAGNHFYTATCNDPNAASDCDGDPGTVDGQFSYGCSFLTFGITSDNSDQKTSITYDFEFPSQICDLQIGDIDFLGSGSQNLASWQDEVDIVADSLGTPVSINAIVGAKVNVYNNNTDSINLVSIYDNTTGGNLLPDDQDGHATITSLGKVTSITFTYSNGPDDDGLSDDHAIRINGFQFCPEEKYEICDNGIDDDEDGNVDSFDPDCPCTDYSFSNLNFDVDPNGQAISNGADPSEIWAAWGIHITTHDPVDNPPRILDSTNPPVNDLDLGTPNTDFGGPGEGNGGESGKIGENGVALNNALIINSTSSTTSLNDKWNGGTLFFNFDSPRNVASLELIDFDFGSVDGYVRAYDNASILIKEVPIYAMGDNSYQKLVVDAQNVSVLEIESNNSFSITSLLFCDNDLPSGEIGDFVWFDANNDGLQVGENGIEGIEVSLYNNNNNLLSRTTTDEFGYYAFSHLPNGTYEVEVSVLGSTIITSDLDGNLDNSSGIFTLGNGVVKHDVDFGLYGEEICDNGIDDDFDGLTDCEDLDCELNDLDPGIISGDEIMCSPFLAGAIESYLDPVFASDIYTLKWQSSLDSTNWTDIAGENGYSFGPNIINSTTYFRRVLINESCGTVVYSNVVTKEIDGTLPICLEDETFDFDCAIGYKISPSGIGLQGVENPAVRVLNKNFMEYYIVEATFQGGANATEHVIFSTLEGDQKVVNKQYFEGESGVNGNRFFRTILPPSDSIFISYEGNSMLAESFVVYTVATMDNFSSSSIGYESVGKSVHKALNPGESYQVGFPLTETINHKEIFANVSLASIVNDGTEIYITVEGAGAYLTDTITQPNKGNTLSLEFINVEEVYPDADSLYITISSPATNGQTALISGYLAAIVECDQNLVITGETDAECVTVGDTITYSYTVFNFADVEFFNLNGNSSLGGAFSFENDTIPPGVQFTTTQDVVITQDMIDNPPLVNDIFVAGWNFSFGIKPKSDGVLDTLVICEICDDGIDNDEDGLTDCLDPDCTEGDAFVITADQEICEGENVDLIVSGGASYVWSHGLGSGDTKTVSPSSSTTYTVTVTNNYGCTGIVSSTVDVTPYPTVNVTGPNPICFGETTTLSPSIGGTWVSSDNSVATVSNSGVVTAVSSGTVNFRFTNSTTLCQSLPTTDITIYDLPTVTVDGPASICPGETTTLSPSNGGSWASSDPSIATVTNSGVVTALSQGTVNFTFTSSTINCESLPTTDITIKAKPVTNVTGPTSICEGFTTTLFPTSGGTWNSANPAIATVTNGGVVTAVSPGTTTFTFTNSTTGCVSDASQPITVNEIPAVAITGPTEICINSTSTLTPSSGGTWTSSDTSIATVSNDGVVMSIGPGTVTFTFTTFENCVSAETAELVVDKKGNVTISGDPIYCIGETTTLTASSGGGTWLSDNTAIATVNSSGVVTAIAAGTATIIYDHNSKACPQDPTFAITIDEEPTVSIAGSAEICVGESTQLSTSGMGGFWSSSDSDIAVISSTGTVVGIAAGSVSFTYTNSNGCASASSATVSVNPEVFASVDFNGSLCLQDDSQLSAIVSGGTESYTYAWTGPEGYSASTETISISVDGNYSLTVTDSKGCSSNTTAFVYEAYEPFIFTLNSEVCEGEDVNLSVNGGAGTLYQWGANAGNSTTSSVTVYPGVPSTTFNVTVTNDIGCSTTASAIIDVTPKPIVNVTGDAQICIENTTQLSPSTGGLWTSSNYSVANVDSNGVVTGLGAGTATFTFQDENTGCYSDPTGIVTVNDNDLVNITGDDQICIEDHPTLLASVSGGTWSSGNTGVATVNAMTGEITPISQGNSIITYSPPSGACFDDTPYSINVYNSPNLSLNGPSTICEGSITYLNASESGTWTSSDESIAVVSISGEVTGIGAGMVNFSFVSAAGCPKDLETPITVIGNPLTSITGPNAICIGETTTLSPISGGSWISSNNGVAIVNNSGVVTAQSPGVASFTFIESSNGCISENNVSVTVDGPPSISSPSDNILCIGQTTDISPSTGGSWQSSNPSIASITDAGEITAISDGTVTFTFTSNLTGCTSAFSSPVTVQPNPSINYTGPTEVCQGETSTITPGSGGFWSSSNVAVATITSQGLITAMSPGSVRFLFTSSSSGCVSDSSEVFTVLQPSTVNVSGPLNICIGGTSNVSPTTGGAWYSSDVSIATVGNDGTVTGVGAGTVTFTFVDGTGCSSESTTEITVEPDPNAIFLGSSSICIGNTTTVSPANGGVWQSSNDAIATVDNNGLVTAISEGTATLTYTNSSTGCSAEVDTELIVNPKPTVSLIGDDEICIGGNTNLSPSSGGSWLSNNNAVASVTSNGLVSGLNPGTATFTFIQSSTGCSSDPSTPITVLDPPVGTITGPNTICEGSTTTLSPSSGGSWESDNIAVATVDNNGVVTGVSQGFVRFTFTSDAGCSSAKTSPVIVYDKPNVILDGPETICLGGTSQMLPSSGGTWDSSNPSVATIDDNGVVTGVGIGTVTFSFTDSNTGCVSDPSNVFTVESGPATSLSGPSEICIGATTNMIPASGGIWTSIDPGIATIDNGGEITAISTGSARFIFMNLSTGCYSDTTTAIAVVSGPETNFNGPTELCLGDTTYILPSSGGTWESINPLVASISNSGMIIGLGEGSTTFRYTETATGCSSELSDALTVNGPPSVAVVGLSSICIDSETTLSPASGGIWESLNPGIASVDNNGIVTGLSEGSAYFRFTDSATGCASVDDVIVEVQAALSIDIGSTNELCMGYTLSLSPAIVGLWTSSNPDIATVSNSGVVTARAPGVVTFTYIDPNTGCGSEGTSDPITIVNCINHDFNVGLKNEELSGDLSTNDLIGSPSSYSNGVSTVSKPLGSIYSLDISNDGTYTFEANKAGKYIFEVPVCVLPDVFACEATTLEINIVDNIYVLNNPIANLEYSTSYRGVLDTDAGQTILIDAIANDTCIYGGGCSLDASTISLIGTPGNGTATINGDYKIEYVSDPGFIGQDTVNYSICLNDGITCTESQQIITVNHTSATNSTIANDDFYYTFRGISVEGNVLKNDFDPEGDLILVTPLGAVSSPKIMAEGEYYVDSSGAFSFTPNDDFTGTVNIVYTMCDAQGFCVDATIHLLVLDDINLNIRVYLEGALMYNGAEETLDGLPLMRDNLRVSPYTGENYMPLSDPYTFDHDPYAGTASKFMKMGPGMMTDNQFITDSLGVFGVEGRNAIVDWVHIELRSKEDNTNVIATRSGLVQRDGDVVDVDGVSNIRFQGINVDSFYVVVKHRSHLGVMSNAVTSEDFIDFTDPDYPVFNFHTSKGNGIDYTGLSRKENVVYGYSALWAGDFDSNGKVKFTNPGDDQNLMFLTVLFSSPEFLINYNNAFGYYNCDYDMNSRAKYTNPNDDLNLLFSQILLYPQNTSFLSNFNSLIEQVPE